MNPDVLAQDGEQVILAQQDALRPTQGCEGWGQLGQAPCGSIATASLQSARQ